MRNKNFESKIDLRLIHAENAHRKALARVNITSCILIQRWYRRLKNK